MRILKPGKVAASTAPESSPRKRSQSSPPAKEREIWDDYLVVKKGRKKKEYERNRDGRLVPVAPKEKDDKPAEGEGVEELDAPSPRLDYQTLEEQLEYTFNDRSLLERALTHRSVLGPRERVDYERLEFLGDAVLDLSVAHLLSLRHPDAREGDLSKMRAALVNTAALADFGKALDIGPFIKLGRGELASGGAERPSILADVMEAIFGAIYWDSNYDQAMQIIERIFGESLDLVTPSDPKTELQEALHAAGSGAPNYLVELVEGPEHAPTFVTVVIVDGEVAGRGRGPTKKAAQQDAAAEALNKLVPSIESIELADEQNVIVAGALLTAEAAKPPEEPVQ